MCTMTIQARTSLTGGTMYDQLVCAYPENWLCTCTKDYGVWEWLAHSSEARRDDMPGVSHTTEGSRKVLAI